MQSMTIKALWPTFLYLVAAIVVGIWYQSVSDPVVAVTADRASRMRLTYDGLQRGEKLSQEGQIEVARIGAHHIGHASDYVKSTQAWYWIITLAGLPFMALQAVVAGQVVRRSRTQDKREKPKGGRGSRK